MKKAFEKTLPELESLFLKIQSRLTDINKFFDADPLEQALAIESTKAFLREQGYADEKLSLIPNGVELGTIIERELEKVRLLQKVELFNAKYEDFFEGEFTMEKTAEYVRDTRWMLPIFIQLYGEESVQVQRMRVVAGLKVEG